MVKFHCLRSNLKSLLFQVHLSTTTTTNVTRAYKLYSWFVSYELLLNTLRFSSLFVISAIWIVLAGTGGQRCATLVGTCTPDYCLNGGACRNDLNTATCLCRPGFSGDRCVWNWSLHSVCLEWVIVRERKKMEWGIGKIVPSALV